MKRTETQPMKIWIAIAILALLIAAILFIPKGSGQKRPPSVEGDYLPGELLVKFKPAASEEERSTLKEQLKVREESYIESISVYHWKGDFDVKTAIEALQKSGHILYAEPNYRVHTQKK